MDPLKLSEIALTEAYCFAAQRRFDRVEAALTQALRQDPDVALDPKTTDPTLVSLLERARSSLHARLDVADEAPGTVLRLDGALLGKSPLAVPVPIGTHTLLRERPEEGSVAQRLTFHADETVRPPLPPHAPRPRVLTVTTAAPSSPLRGALEARAIIDPTTGVGVAASVGAFLPHLYALLGAGFGGGVGVNASVGGRLPKLLGPVGFYLSVDGVLLVSPAVVPGYGATLGVSLALPAHFELVVEGAYRGLATNTTFNARTGLVNAGVRWFFGGS